MKLDLLPILIGMLLGGYSIHRLLDLFVFDPYARYAGIPPIVVIYLTIFLLVSILLILRGIGKLRFGRISVKLGWLPLSIGVVFGGYICFNLVDLLANPFFEFKGFLLTATLYLLDLLAVSVLFALWGIKILRRRTAP